jgi:hypothetical protein
MSQRSQHMACAILFGCALATGALAANPKWPTKIVGTWKGISNQSPLVLTVSTQTTGTSVCDNITGTIQDVNGGFTGNMIGFYCPSSGAVEFMRYPSGSNVPYQAYNGNLSQIKPPAGVKGILMGGSFGQYSTVFGPLGQASFSFTN